MAVWVTGSTTGAGTGAEGGALATGWGAGGGAAGATGWGFGSIGLKRAGSAAMISGFAGSSGLAGFAGSMAGGTNSPGLDRKSVVEGKSVCVRLDPGGCRIIKKK